MPRIEKRLSLEKKKLLLQGGVIPAHPLALKASRKFDELHQRVLTLYYLSAGASGIAVGVHSTQFEIREYGLFEPVLRVASETIKDFKLRRPFLKVAGVCGSTNQAVEEAGVASDLGYDLALVSVIGVESWSEQQLLERLEKIGEILPVFAFYLQPSAGGVLLSYEYWREAASMPNVLAIKVAPFDRYKTIEVVRAAVESKRRDEIALYTGNDDSIVQDLITPFQFVVEGRRIEKYMVGGLLGQWAMWTKGAVKMLDEIRKFRLIKTQLQEYPTKSLNLLRIASQLTDANSAIFDSRNKFRGLLPGVNEVLRRQGLVSSTATLKPNPSTLSQSQTKEIDRVLQDYPNLHMQDDKFVSQNLEDWIGIAKK